ncbi:MAG: DUF1624 domain-containing protein [Candidatus Heimdallarchaeota archaeon]|nr:DUF1624 domain-containing protein [Candidatus Heimdallarchaeota archaeon]
MSITSSQEINSISGSKRFLTLDISRGLAIVVMLILHIIADTLDINNLLSDFNSIPVINLLALTILPFLGGLAGFFLLVSSTGNMISMYRELNKGHSIKSIVLKQIISGFLLLGFAMLTEGLIGYHGSFGEFFRHLDDPSQTPWQNFRFGWNVFETIHTIAWCLIINGCVQGLLSLKANWKNISRMIISYVILAVIVIGITQPIWDLVNYLVPGYPFGTYPNGHSLATPWIGYEPFWHIVRAPFLTALAAPMEPLFPYLAVSFIGSIIGIVLSQPKTKINKNFPRKIFLVGTGMFVSGLIGIVFILLQIFSGTYNTGTNPLFVTIEFYRYISFHRHWAPDAMNVIYPGETVIIPPFSWVAQFIAVNGLSLMLFIFLFRFIEFRGKSKTYAEKTKNFRRFGIVAFSNYNNQWLYFYVFYFVSSVSTFNSYQKPLWGGVFVIILLTYLLYSMILYFWEKIKYFGSLEWFIKTVSNNITPVRRKSFDKGTKWWQKGLIDADKTFYNAQWIGLDNVGKMQQETEMSEVKTEKSDSKFALILSLVGVCSILFMPASIFSLGVSLNARKNEGKNRINTASFILSIIGCIFFAVVLLVSFILPIGVLGLF